MCKLQLLGAAALAVLASATGAQAAHVVVFGPTADVAVSAAAHQGPNLGGSYIRIINGNVVQSGNDPGGSVSAGPQQLGATTVWAEAIRPSPTLGSHAYGYGSLDQGVLKAFVNNTGPNTFGSPLGDSNVRLSDTLFFNNQSGGDLRLALTFSFDGTMTDLFEGNPSGSAQLYLGGCGGCGNGFGTPIRFAATHQAAGGANRAFFNENGVYDFNDTSGADSPNWTTWASSEGIAGSITANLLIPTGLTSLGVGADLQLDCRGGSDCDFSHTGAFSFSALPEGLSYTSASGVFLTQAQAAVPEPGAWALLILGFGAAGSVLRRRRPQVA